MRTTDPHTHGSSPTAPAGPGVSPITPVALREQTIDGERILHVGPAVLVASGSQPGAWYVVEEGRCTCPSFSYRGHCRHLAPAHLAAELDRAQAAPIATVVPASTEGKGTGPACSRCGTTGRRLLTMEMVCSSCLEGGR
jgi:hypothetical protein